MAFEEARTSNSDGQIHLTEKLIFDLKEACNIYRRESGGVFALPRAFFCVTAVYNEKSKAAGTLEEGELHSLNSCCTVLP